MEYNKFDVITLKNNNKFIVLEKIQYEEVTYLYVDRVNNEETETLEDYQIFRVCEGNKIQKETDIDLLTNILPLFSKKIKLEEE